MCCNGDRDFEAIRSWFHPLVGADWTPLRADVQIEVETDRETALRALFRRPDGSLREVIRRKGIRSFSIKAQRPSPSILRGFRMDLSA
jgi:hypothetical protein